MTRIGRNIRTPIENGAISGQVGNPDAIANRTGDDIRIIGIDLELKVQGTAKERDDMIGCVAVSVKMAAEPIEGEATLQPAAV